MMPRPLRLFRSAPVAPLAAGIIVLICALSGCSSGGDDSADAAADPAVVHVKTAVAQRQAFQETLDAIGVVTARPGHIAELSAPTPTRITQVLVTVGQHVTAGTPLVELDSALFEADARSADAALATAQNAYDRASRLVAAGIMARKELDLAASDQAQAKAAAVAAHRNQTLATLRAPIDGVVTKLTAVLGASADPSQPLVEVADPNALDIAFRVPPSAAAHIRADAAVILTAGQQAGSLDSLGTGTVKDIAATVDSASNSVTVLARCANPKRALRIGETIFGRIIIATHPNAVTVPIQALVPDGETMTVFVIDSANVAHAESVSVGGRTSGLAEITHGLSGGETVVTDGAYGVTDGAKVVSAETRK